MSRDTSTSVTSANAANVVNWSMLAKIALNSSTLYACTGNRFVFDGTNTWSPVGGFGGVEPIREDLVLQTKGVRMWLSAISSSQLYEPLTENLFMKTVRLYRATLASSGTGWAIVGTPQQCFKGVINRVDVNLKDAERGNYYEIEAETSMAIEGAELYYNRETINQTYSGDTFFDYVPKIANFVSNWGGKSQFLSGLGQAPSNTSEFTNPWGTDGRP